MGVEYCRWGLIFLGGGSDPGRPPRTLCCYYELFTSETNNIIHTYILLLQLSAKQQVKLLGADLSKMGSNARLIVSIDLLFVFIFKRFHCVTYKYIKFYFWWNVQISMLKQDWFSLVHWLMLPFHLSSLYYSNIIFLYIQ